MAIVKNPLMNGVTGGMNKLVVYRQVGDKTVISAYPDFSHRKLSPKQIRMNNYMAEATSIARETMADPQQRDAAQVRLNVTRNRLFNALVREHIKSRIAAAPPEERT